MQKAIQQLLKVQDKDQRIDNLTRMVDSVPEEKEKIRNDLQGAEDKLEAAKEGMQSIQIKIKDLESDVDALKSRIIDLRTKSNDVKKNDEYRAIMDQIDTHEKAISDYEDQELELMEELEGAKEKFSQAEKEKQAADARIQAAEKDLDVREKNCKTQIEKLQAERDELAKEVPEELLRRYERLIKGDAGGNFRKGLATIEHGMCSYCHLSIQPDVRVKARQEFGTNCANCGTLLYTDK